MAVKKIDSIKKLIDAVTPRMFEDICSELEIDDRPNESIALSVIGFIIEFEKRHGYDVSDDVIDEILVMWSDGKFISQITSNFREKNLNKILGKNDRKTRRLS